MLICQIMTMTSGIAREQLDVLTYDELKKCWRWLQNLLGKNEVALDGGIQLQAH
jgi:hypothetical protein